MPAIVEYNHSFDSEVYPLIFPAAFYNLLYEEVVDIIYSLFNIVLFAVDIPILSCTGRKVSLYPKGHIIQSEDIGLVVAENLNTVYDISRFDAAQSHQQQTVLEAVRCRWKDSSGGSGMSHTADKVNGGLDFHLDGTQPGKVPCSPAGLERLREDMRNMIESNAIVNEQFHTSSSRNFEAGVSGLEEAMDDILGWPLPLKYGRPHAVVLERNELKILRNLESSSVDIVDLKKPHVLVCCQGEWPVNLFYFLKELRKPNFPNFPVVILHPVKPDAYQWGSVGIFKDVYFVKGWPVHEIDLMRAGILQAAKVVVLSYPGCPLDASGKGVEQSTSCTRRKPGGYTSDVDCILILANLERLLQGDLSKVLIEMRHAIGLHYLWPHSDIPSGCFPRNTHKRNPDALSHFAPAYMEGRAVSSSMLEFLTRASFYNKNTISIVEQLVEGGVAGGGYSDDEQLGVRVLEQMEVPQGFVGKTYGDMFVHLLLNRGMLAMGLYRARGTHRSVCPYVFTNPPTHSLVNASDLVYVITS